MGIKDDKIEDVEILIESRIKKSYAIFGILILAGCVLVGLNMFQEPNIILRYGGLLTILICSYGIVLTMVNIFFFRIRLTKNFLERRIGWPWLLGVFNSTKTYSIKCLESVVKSKSRGLPVHRFNLHFSNAILPVQIGSSITNSDEILVYLTREFDEFGICDKTKKYLKKIPRIKDTRDINASSENLGPRV